MDSTGEGRAGWAAQWPREAAARVRAAEGAGSVETMTERSADAGGDGARGAPAGLPEKILITGGHEIGGISSFAEALRGGFEGRGIGVEILAPGTIFRRRQELRDARILKILSTAAVFAAPVARRTLCMAHGVPRADAQGWRTVCGIIASFHVANRCSGVQLVSVSHYTAATLRAVFNVRTDAVIRNPVKPLFLEPVDEPHGERNYLTYAGRLIAAKNPHRMIPALRDVLDENPGLRVCIIGQGKLRPVLESMIGDDPRFEFRDAPDDVTLREWLRRTRVFFSGNEVEGFGITYLEALTQGCIVAMPAGGGGLEIAPEQVGAAVQLLPLSWDRREIVAALRRALGQVWAAPDTRPFTIDAVAGFYLEVDSRFAPDGRIAGRRG